MKQLTFPQDIHVIIRSIIMIPIHTIRVTILTNSMTPILFITLIMGIITMDTAGGITTIITIRDLS
ncbi:MAG: hypothetical protein K2Y18_02585 [Alphaproteobacteria bacterium]|nr:hypothetical protein [Alphaproteobacteria bacterium]